MKKETILEKYSEREIYLHFLNLTEFPSGNISSPFSDDKNPSFKLYKNGTFKCHSTGKQGDIWQFVADLKQLNCKTDFVKVLDVIAKEMNIDDDSKHFTYTCKALSSIHYDYWRQGFWGVTEGVMDHYGVRALDKFEFYSSKTNQIQKNKIYKGIAAFAYELNGRAEIYIPKQNKASKFNLNKTLAEDIFGLKQLLDHHDTILLTAGKKDALICAANGIPAVSFRSENHNPTQAQIKLLRDKCTNLCICYDNDEQGQRAMLQIAQEYSLIQVHINSRFNDIADMLLLEEPEKLKSIIQEAVSANKAHEEKPQDFTVFHRTEEYLSSFYKFRYNEIALDIEVCRKGWSDWESLNENTLFLELQKNGIKISMNNLLAILKSSFVPKYNPIKHYFDQLPKWDKKTDYIGALANYVQPIDRDQFNYHFKKWLVRSVKCALESHYFNKQAFILVHRGQNTGKSTFCRFLCPPTLSQYIAEDISQDKDARILLCKNFIINLDELAGLNKKELTSLKSIFSKTQINERLPYDRKNSILPRICSFIGSTNEDNFLNDDTGSVRWLCFRITSIDWKYSQQINIDQVWSQAYALMKSDFDCELSIEDIRLNEDRNKVFQQLSMEQELLNTYIEPSDEENGEFMTATDIIVYLKPLGVNLNRVQLGKALSSMDYKKIKHKTKQVYGYWVEPRSLGDGHTAKTFDDVLKNFNNKN